MRITTSAATAFGIAVVGWAYCGALIGVGRRFLSMEQALIVHAVGAPIGFAVLSWFYHRRFFSARPLKTTVFFLIVVIALDLFIVALVVERSFGMFRSPIGTWIPFILIFGASYLSGRLAQSGN